jgi:predicted aspartyl protease
MRGRYVSLLSVLMGFVTVVAPPAAKAYQQTGPRLATEATVGFDLSFDLYRDYLIVARGSAGPLKDLNFLLDTGASPAVLDPRIANKLHLDEQPASIAVLDGSVEAGMAIVPSLQIGPIRRDKFPVLIEDLSFLQKALPVRIDAVIGLDVLGQSTFLIDYTSRKIHFGPAPALPISIPFRVKKGLAIVDAEINHAPVHLLLDTGAFSLTIFEREMPGFVLKTSAVQRPAKPIGDFERKQVRLRSLRLGETEFGQEPAFVVQNRNGGEQDFDGLMSPAALGITRLVVDPGRGEIEFSR